MNNHKIIFKDGTIEFVSREKYFALIKESGNPANQKFILRNNQYEFADIKRMVEPPKEAIGFDFNKMLSNRTPEKRKQALQGMIKGLEGYIDSDRYQGTDKPKQLLELMKASLKKT